MKVEWVRHLTQTGPFMSGAYHAIYRTFSDALLISDI